MKDMARITRIEEAFFNMGKKDVELQEYFFTYYSQKLILLNHFYPHVQEQIPYYTNHGPDHIVRIMRLYEKMLKNNVPGIAPETEISEMLSSVVLNFYEIYLLLCATVWHDVGNLLGREQHNQKITEISDRLKNHFFVDGTMEKYALQIARAHTGNDAVRKEIPIEDIDYRNEEINLRFLGALLRLVDELEEGEVRIDRPFYESMEYLIPENNKIHWEIARCIKRIEPKPDDAEIEIHTRIDQGDLFKLFAKDGRKIALIDGLISKIDEINQKRIYYMQFIRKHLEYRKITLHITIENAEPERIAFEFTNDQAYEAFWRICPRMNPKIEIRGYSLQKEVGK